ncbi:alpha/beta hydrolase [Pedobacter sp. GR22-10]|jgi:alpha-glucosidase|uniref:alpha/beta hydrolase n=1 Tax=Pedobacter sp. GR22-10 TaxID=2994472 RepID=UPI00224681F1|nr:alpha/beta hydrolase-fold protein [Pedobacter sp. GR22-10]MCX2432504.1 alpha/beta hydrolase-fold protein [Pedobacter sp. GR22-10]
MDVRIENWKENLEQQKPDYQFGDHVHVVDEKFYMPQLDKHRQVWIYLPKSYKDSEKKYPVLYMHDGQHLFHAKPARNDEWAVDTTVDNLIREGLQEMIIVGINHGEEDRLTEYNPYDSENGKGEGKAYLQFLVETLMPFINHQYRTLTDMNHTAIAGSSLGGLISMFAIAEYPEVFGSAGIFSPAFWLGPEIYTDVTDRLPGLKGNKIFLVAGDKEGTEMVNNVKKIHAILNPDGSNQNILFHECEDGKHTEWFWHREFPAFYSFIAKDSDN